MYDERPALKKIASLFGLKKSWIERPQLYRYCDRVDTSKHDTTIIVLYKIKPAFLRTLISIHRNRRLTSFSRGTSFIHRYTTVQRTWRKMKFFLRQISDLKWSFKSQLLACQPFLSLLAQKRVPQKARNKSRYPASIVRTRAFVYSLFPMGHVKIPALTIWTENNARSAILACDDALSVRVNILNQRVSELWSHACSLHCAPTKREPDHSSAFHRSMRDG